MVLITWLHDHGNKLEFGKHIEGEKKSRKKKGKERVTRQF